MRLRCSGGPLNNSVREVPDEALVGGVVEFLIEEEGRPRARAVYRLEMVPMLVHDVTLPGLVDSLRP